jgi:hypothetical protein
MSVPSRMRTEPAYQLMRRKSAPLAARGQRGDLLGGRSPAATAPPSGSRAGRRRHARGRTAHCAKIVTRAKTVLASSCGLGTNAIMREARVSKPTVWRWQTAL